MSKAEVMEASPMRAETVGMAMVTTRETQEVQGAIVMARKFPRDLSAVEEGILKSCSLKSLAEKSQYAYQRGTTLVTGESIRLAEELARNFGNMDYGIVELERKSVMGSVPGESTMMAYCWDLESNVRSRRVFTVKHRRDTRQGSYNLTDERDIYEMTANQGARRLRACILERIPKFLREAALDKCDETLKKTKDPMNVRIEKMITVFADLNVTKEMIAKRIGHNVDSMNETELIGLGKIYNSIKDGFSAASKFFEGLATEEEDLSQDVQTQDAKPATASNVKSVKNFAPQTQKEAIDKDVARAQPGQQVSAAAKGEDPEVEAKKSALIKKIVEHAKTLKMDTAALSEKFKTLVNKAPAQCNLSELLAVWEIMEAEGT